MNLKDFTGGLNTRVHSTKISPLEATMMINVEHEAGTISSIKKPKLIQENVGKFSVYFNDKLYSTDEESYFVEYGNYLYAFSPSEGNYKLDSDLNRTSIGIEPPVNILGAVEDGEGSLSGTYQYRYTYYNDNDGSESRPSEATDEIEVEDKNITLDGFVQPTDTQVTHIRLYRIGGNLSIYTLVDTLDTTVTNYTDTKSDDDIAGEHQLDTIVDYTPLDGIKNVILFNAMMFGTYEDKLYYSEIGRPDRWSRLNYIDFDNELTGIGATQHGLLVFTRDKTYIVTGNSPTTLSKYLLDGEHGCVNHNTIVYTNNQLVWLSKYGVCISNGGNITLITQDKLGLLTIDDSINAMEYDKMYILSTSTYILVLDFRYNICIRRLRYSGRVFRYKSTPYIVKDGSLYELFGSEDKEFMVYHTGLLTEGEFTNLKHYKDIYIAYEGAIKIKAILYGEAGDILVVNKYLPVDKRIYNIKSLGNRKGYAIQFRISGVGEVSEIQYKVVGRENAR